MKSYNAMKRIIVIMIVSLLASCFAANGQSMLERLGQRAKNAVENKIGEKVEQGVNDVLDGKKKKKDKADKQTADPVSQDAVAMPDAKVPAQPKKFLPSLRSRWKPLMQRVTLSRETRFSLRILLKMSSWESFRHSGI